MKNVLEYVEHSAELYPDKTAFADENNYVTYSQLLELSRKTGLFLAEQLDTVRNRPVAVLLSKTAYSIGAFMGVVYSGNFYVVIDEQMPVDRINTILEALNPVAVLTDEAHMETASKLKVGNINEENNDQGYNNGEAVKKYLLWNK